MVPAMLSAMTETQRMEALAQELHKAGYLLNVCKKGTKESQVRAFTEKDLDIDEVRFFVRRECNLAVKMGRTLRSQRVMGLDREAHGLLETQAFKDEHGLASPMEVVTRSGGEHVYLLVPEEVRLLRTRIRALGLPMDWKLTGYCLIAGVVEGGAYALKPGKEIVPPSELPVFPASLLLEDDKPERRPAACGADLGGVPERMLRYVEKIDESRQGSSGSSAVMRAALKILNLAEGDLPLAWSLLRHYNATRCSPPWDESEDARPEDSLMRKLTEALRSWKPR